jgi:predicted phage terminase large subunit-like protein
LSAAAATTEQDPDRRLQLVERLLRVKQAKDDLITFTEVTMPDASAPEDATKTRYSAQYFHRALAAALQEVEAGRIKRLIITWPPRHGKALALETPIPTPRGWVRIQDLKPGDEVFDARGDTTRVVAVSPIWRDRDVWRVVSDDGAEVIADAEHEWPVRVDRGHPVVRNKTTAWLAARTSPRRPMLAVQGAVSLPDRQLPIDPYVLGVWLGDGRTDSSAICSNDNEIVEEIARLEPGLNHYAAVGGTMHFRPGPHYRRGAAQIETLQGRLRALGLLGNKHIPHEYMWASEQQRLSLLQGLIDTDGHVAPTGQTEFCTTLPGLAEQVQGLVRSLGRKASLIEDRAQLNGVDMGPRYRVMFYMEGAARLPRKAARCRNAGRTRDRYLSFEPAGKADTVCIEVDSPDHTFLCGKGFLVTHNSELASKRFPAWYIGRNPSKHLAFGTYNQEFADDFGRAIRDIIKGDAYQQVFPGVELKVDSQAANRLQTKQEGALYFVGRGGPLTGRGADCIIIDDPLKNSEEADSATTRNSLWEWFNNDVMSRFMTDEGRAVIISTRWHMDDLVGRLTDPKNPCYNEDEARQWKVINIPALAEEDDVLGRAPGAPLWPERFGLEYLLGFKRRNPRGFNALYQQRPTAEDGEFFKAEHLVEYLPDQRPPVDRLKVYMSSDHAVAQKQHNDKTCILIVGVDQNDNIWVLDCYWKRAPSDQVVEKLIDMIQQWKPITWWAEDDHITKSIGPFLRKRMRERKVYLGHSKVPSYIDKQKKAHAIRGRASMGMVLFPKTASWWVDAKDELLKFPYGAHDDFVDALSTIGRGLGVLVAPAAPKTEDTGPKTGTFGWIKQSARIASRDARVRRTLASM